MSEVHLRTGRRFCERIARVGLRGVDGVFVYNSAGLELLEAARRDGLRAVMEQTILPRSLQYRLREEERALFPDYESAATADPAPSC